MEKTFKKSIAYVIELSLIIYSIFIILFIPWIGDLYTYVFNKQVSFIVLILVGVLLLIFALSYIFTRHWECIFKKNVCTTTSNCLFFKRKTYTFYNPKNITIEKSGGIIKRFAGLVKIRLYEDGKKVLNVDTDQDSQKDMKERRLIIILQLI